MSERWTAPGSEPQPGVPYTPPPGWSAPSVGPGAAPTSAGWAAVDLQPGVIPLRPLALGDIYGAVMRTIRVNPRASIGLAALVSLAVLLPVTAISTAVAALTSGDLTGVDELGLSSVISSLPSLGSLLIAGLLAAFMAWVVSQAVLGRTVTLGQTWAAVRGRAVAATGVVLLVAVVQVVVLALLVGPGAWLAFSTRDEGLRAIVPGVVLAVLGGLLGMLALAYLGTRWSFATSVLAVERTGLGAALRRSWGLTAGRPFWRILGIQLLTSVAVSLVAQVVALPLGLLLGVGGAVTAADHPGRLVVAQTVTNGLTALLAGALTTPITAGVNALLYVDQRIRREGLDVAVMRGLGEGRPDFPAPPAGATPATSPATG